MILIPQYRTARRASASALNVNITEIVTATAVSTTATLSFAGTPADGERIVAFVVQAGATPDITAVPSGFTLQVQSDVNRTVRIYDKLASSETNSYTFTATSNLTVSLFRLSGGSLSASGTNNAASATTIALSSSGLLVPDNAVLIGGLSISGTGTPTNSDSFTTIFHNTTTRGWAHYREYTTGGSGLNCTASWTNARNVDSCLGVYS